MSSKRFHHRSSRRPLHRNFTNRQRPAKSTDILPTHEAKLDLIRQFNAWSMSLRTVATFEFDRDESNHCRCKMLLPIFPNLQSIGHGASSKKEAKANAIIAFLASMEKRNQVGLFVPYLSPSLLRHIQSEIRQANVPVPDLNININDYLLAERILAAYLAKRYDNIMKILQRICDVRVIRFWQSKAITFVYIVGPKSKQELIRPYTKALFEPDQEQMFSYGERLFDVFNDEKFLDDVCQRLKVLCHNEIEKCKLFIRGSPVNVQCCYNEFVCLRREYENEFYRSRQQTLPTTTITSKPVELKNITPQLESTRIDQDEKIPEEEKDVDQLPDYSIYDDDVNASMLRVLRDDEDNEEKTLNQEVAKNNEPVVIELSDDSSDEPDLQIVQTVKPVIKNTCETSAPAVIQAQSTHLSVPTRPQPMPDYISLSQAPVPLNISQPQRRILRHIVLDGQNIARNSNDYNGSFSWSRLSNAINYFKNRGHENVIAFLPLYYRDFSNKQLPINEMNRERQIRDTLINARSIAFTPSRYNKGQRLTNYDDRFILQYAADNDGVVVSNDNFRDLQHERNFQFVINNRILPFATINDTFMPATDPLGRNGPHLDEFLSKPK